MGLDILWRKRLPHRRGAMSREGADLFRCLLLAAILAMTLAHAPALAEEGTAPPLTTIAEFFRSVTGEWIGVCKQSTDKDAAEDKYFKAIIKESSPCLFEARFDYYRPDCKGGVLHIGTSNVTASITATGATGRVVGNGEVLVERKVKKQEHDLVETLTVAAPGVVMGRGSGSLKVSGMPLGLGKLGKVRDDQSTWRLSNGTLCVQQSLNIVFKALFISKSFRVDAAYTAVRGTDVSALIPKQTPATAP